MEKAHPPVFLARNRNGLIEFEDDPVGLFRHIACNADGNMHERQHRDPIIVHVFDFLIQVAPAEDVEDKLVAVACPNDDIRGTFRAVLESNTGCPTISYYNIRGSALIVDLASELLVEFGYLGDDLVRSSEGHTGVVKGLNEACHGNHGVAKHWPPGCVDEEPDGTS